MCAEGHQYCPTCGFPVATLGTNNKDKFVGKTLPGGYHILDLISVGGMGRVYRAEQSALGRTVAVKIIHPHLLSDENSALRFITEARAASQLNHPNSVAVFDFGRTDDGQPYLVMEFLRGKDLARVAYEEGPLPFTRIIDVLRQCLAALAEAHELGIVHRDLKPENIILEPLRRGGDFVKVVDFGLAKLKADTQAPSVTSPGIVCGTPDYMAPEQGRGDAIDGRSDLYAIGVILFQLLTGRLPFEAEGPTQVVMMHLSIPVPDPRQVAPERNIPAPLVDVLFKAMEKDASRRYQDALEFSDALGEALALIQTSPPSARRTLGPSSILPGATLACPSCQALVPQAKFCLECGARLPQASLSPEATTPPQLPLPLVERDDDLAWLDDRRQELAGTIRGARLAGDAGFGKTRLLREFAERARAAGDTFVLCGPDPYGVEVACSALRDAVGALLGLDEGEHAGFDAAPKDARRGLDELFGTEARADKRSPIERRHALSEALRWALLEAAGTTDGHVIVAIDDLHRVDAPSRSAFADVLGEPPDCGALFIAAHPPGFESGWSADHPARMLDGLSPPAVSRLLRSSRGAERLRGLSDDARGAAPLHVDQLVRYALEGGSDPPSRLADLIARRVDTLEPNARRVLQALAVLGDLSEPKDVARLLPKSQQLDGTLDTLRGAGMIERSGTLISTSHPLLREIVLAGIPAGVRRELHGKALIVSEKRGAPLEARAQHAYFSQDSFQALLLLEQVAARAAARGDNGAEVLALRRGLEIARQEISRGELDDPLRAVLIFGRKLGTALTHAGNFADAEGILREALDVAGPSGTERAKVLSALAQVAHGRHRSSEALGYIDEAIANARQSGAQELVSSLSDTRRSWAS
ncbi:MAG: protein kinase [Sorangiineae bacterium]|nr:protein kinase [Polyangiaceae bacterium]MEB2320905.1 protein kinase [Sorangiineae bacterium]